MRRGLNILEEEHSYLCEVQEIIVHTKTDITLKLSWNVIEVGVTREMMIRDLEDGQFLYQLERCEDIKKRSLRKGLKTKKLPR